MTEELEDIFDRSADAWVRRDAFAVVGGVTAVLMLIGSGLFIAG